MRVSPRKMASCLGTMSRVLSHRTFASTSALAMSSLPHRAGRVTPVTSSLRALVGPRQALPTGALCVAVRHQGSLQSLLDDPNDPYLAAITDVDLVRIACIAEGGPRPSRPMAKALQKGQQLRDAPPPLASRAAQSEGEAVLQSLYEAGLERLREAEAEAAKMEADARAAYAKLSDAEKMALMREQWIAHMFDALCATNAVLRMQLEDQGATAEEIDAAYKVYELVQKEAKPFATPERWEEDFVQELKELAVMFTHVKDSRPINH